MSGRTSAAPVCSGVQPMGVAFDPLALMPLTEP
jgi:hypothetical protein